MWLNFLIALLCSFMIFIAIFAIKERLLSPVSVGYTTDIVILIEPKGDDGSLEQTLKSLVCLHESGTLKADIVLMVKPAEVLPMLIAEKFAAEYDYIYCDNGDS